MVRETTTSRAGTTEGGIHYAARLKLFGNDAERIEKTEYDRIVGGITEKAVPYFRNVQVVEQLADKDSFGDLDFVCLPQTQGHLDESFFRRIYGETLRAYHVNGPTHSILVRVPGKEGVQVDFNEASDPQDYARKMMYYSKGHISAVLTILADKLGFKYSTEGFFRRYEDSRGTMHDILLTGSLREGLEMLGLEPERYDEIHNSEGIVDFIISSPYFDSNFYTDDNLNGRARKRAERARIQRDILTTLAEKNIRGNITDATAMLTELHKRFPEYYGKYDQGAKAIEDAIANAPKRASSAITRELIGAKLGFKDPRSHGREIGRVIRYIHLHYPEIDPGHLTTELLEQIRKAVSED